MLRDAPFILAAAFFCTLLLSPHSICAGQETGSSKSVVKPAEEPPVEKPATEKPPVEKPAAEELPTEKPASEEPPTEELPTREMPAEKSPASEEQATDGGDSREGPQQHPLVPAIQFARDRIAFIRKNVRDFTCILVKRERIGGRLRDYEYIQTRVRLEQWQNGYVSTPFSVYMRFLAPADCKGRKVLFVHGENGGKMLVRNGGKRFSYVTIRLEPKSDAAMKESRYPITETGLENVTLRLLEKAEEDMRFDPSGANTRVTFFRGAKVNGRPCTHIQVVHPAPDTNLNFHIANVYADDELQVPIRVESFDWPGHPDEEAPLLEEYTFTRLRLNVGLTEAHFDPSVISK